MELGYSSTINESLTGHVRPLFDAEPHPDNARTHDIPAIMASLLKFGQRTPIVVQSSTGWIVKGNGTWEAAKELGWNELAQLWQDLDDDTARAYLLADNKTSDRATYERKKLIALLGKAVEGPGLLDTAWSIDELEDLIAADGVPEAPPTEFTGAFGEAPEVTEARRKQAATPQEARREVPLVYLDSDHQLFKEYVLYLQKRWSHSTVQGTVLEAVKRQYQLETGGVGTAGQVLFISEVDQAKAEALAEFRDVITTLGVERQYSGAFVIEQINLLIPVARPAPEVSVPVEDAGQEVPPEAPEAEDADLAARAEAIDAGAAVAVGEATAADPFEDLGFWDEVSGEGAP